MSTRMLVVCDAPGGCDVCVMGAPGAWIGDVARVSRQYGWTAQFIADEWLNWCPEHSEPGMPARRAQHATLTPHEDAER